MPSDQKSDEGMYTYRLIDDKKYSSKKKKKAQNVIRIIAHL